MLITTVTNGAGQPKDVQLVLTPQTDLEKHFLQALKKNQIKAESVSDGISILGKPIPDSLIFSIDFENEKLKTDNELLKAENEDLKKRLEEAELEISKITE